MIKLKFSIILLCVALPPLLYITSVQVLERYAAARFRAGLERVYIGDIQPLLDGTRTVQTAIQQNVDAYLDRSRWLAWGAHAVVTVRAGEHTLLYPSGDLQTTADRSLNHQPLQVAAENYRLLNNGLRLSIDFHIHQNTPVTNTLLAACILFAAGLLFAYYRRWKQRYQQYIQDQTRIQDQLARKSRGYEEQLAAIENERSHLNAEIEQMQSRLAQAREQAEANEEEMLEEIIALEDKIGAKLAQQEQQQAGIDDLQTKIAQLESQLHKEQGRKTKPADTARKRLTTLYKNLEIDDRAIDGYIGLTEDLKIKCEEVIHQLDADPSLVPIKRKVFGKKNRATVFEIVFAYKGRLYYRPTPANKPQILTIGTKNTQQQDLTYLNSL